MKKKILTFVGLAILWSSSQLHAQETTPPVPPKGHPRVFFRKEHVPHLLEKTKHPRMQQAWKDLMASDKMEDNAFVYALTGDKEKGRMAIKTALDTLVNDKYIVKKVAIATHRNISDLVFRATMVYDWCYDLLSGEEKQLFFSNLVRLGNQMECQGDLANWKVGQEFVGHAGEGDLMRTWLALSIAVYDENPEYYDILKKRLFEVFFPVRNFFFPGHKHHQGLAYSHGRFYPPLNSLLLFKRMSNIDVFVKDVSKVPYYWIYSRVPKSDMLRDGDAMLARGIPVSLVYLQGYSKDPFLHGAYLESRERAWLSRTRKPFPVGPLTEMLFYEPSFPERPTSELPLSYYFNYPFGQMIARTGWDLSDESSDVIVEMKINERNFANHSHFDAGAFQIYHKGWLALDSGSYNEGYSAPSRVQYSIRTIAHNTLLIYDPDEDFLFYKHNDGGQRVIRDPSPNLDELHKNKRGTITGTVLARAIGPDPNEPIYTHLKGDITPAYSSKAKKVQRSFTFLNLKNKENPAVLIVRDEVTSSDPSFKKYWLLHMAQEPKIDKNVTVCLNTDETDTFHGKLVTHSLLPKLDDLNIEPVGGPGKEYWVFGKNYLSSDKRERNNKEYRTTNGNWRVQVSTKKPQASNTFLHVLQPVDATQDKILTPKLLEQNSVMGVLLPTHVVFMSKDGHELNGKTTIEIPSGSENLKVVVTDLAPGTWSVYSKGVSKSAKLSKENAVFYFEAGPGRYELVHSETVAMAFPQSSLK